MWEDFILAKTTTEKHLQRGCFLITTLSLFPEIGARQTSTSFMSIISFGTFTYRMIEIVYSITPIIQKRVSMFREAKS